MDERARKIRESLKRRREGCVDGGGVDRGEETSGGWWRREGSANGGSGREGWIEDAEEKSRGARRRDK